MIELVPFDETHFDDLIEWTPSAEFLYQWAGPSFTFPFDHQQLTRLLASGDGPDPAAYLFTARQVSDRAPVGHGEIGHIDRANHCARLNRILVGPAWARGRGYGERLVRELVKFGFGTLDLHRLSLNVLDGNAAAIACYQRAGFQRDAARYETRRHDGQDWNICSMSLRRGAWDPARNDDATEAKQRRR